MTRKNLAHARWHYYRQLTLFTSLELFQAKRGPDCADELLMWVECMAQARSAVTRGDRAWWQGMAAGHRVHIQQWKLYSNARYGKLQAWADSYGQF